MDVSILACKSLYVFMFSGHIQETKLELFSVWLVCHVFSDAWKISKLHEKEREERERGEGEGEVVERKEENGEKEFKNLPIGSSAVHTKCMTSKSEG